MEYPKKLIEVALPLDDINYAASKEKLIRHNHPSTLHLWWSRKPLAAARAILFAQLVNDPGGKRGYGKYKGQTKEDAQRERERLFQIIRELVKWENTDNEKLLARARDEIKKSWDNNYEITGTIKEQMPPFLDPFAGGGSIPFEARKLGLDAYAADLNPVAVMINKAMIEIPPKFIGRKPIGPLPPGEGKQSSILEQDWPGTRGLAEDVRRYGYWIREEAFKKIGHLYPKIELPQEYGGGKATVIAWLWSRTVKCPNPACNCQMPLLSKLDLSTKKGNCYNLIPIIYGNKIKFSIASEEGKKHPGTINRNGASCLCCNTSIPFSHIRSEGKKKNLQKQLIAVVADGLKKKIYLPATDSMEKLACSATPKNVPITSMPEKALGFRVQEYGYLKHCDLFSDRQLVTLTTFSDLVIKVREKIISNVKVKGRQFVDEKIGINGSDLAAYADAVTVYLSFVIDRLADYYSTFNSWQPGNQQLSHTFARQALPMSWDFAEANPFSGKGGSFDNLFEWTIQSIPNLSLSKTKGYSILADVRSLNKSNKFIISTDPPYYDNIGYSDLSDFFYIWMRRTIKEAFPNVFSTLLVPKHQELVATPERHGGKKEAENFFLEGMSKALISIREAQHPIYPLTIYYAFKQTENNKDGTSSMGWESMLEAIIKANFLITGTWPIHTEMKNRIRSIGSNTLSSSVVLVCRKRHSNSETISRKQFLRELDESLPESLEDMIGGKEGASPIAPVDLAQAAIGPGMAVFSKYTAVLEADGSPMTVHTALTLINKAIDEYFTHAESDMGADTRFCVDWFQQYGFKEGPFGEADVLARAKGTTVDGVQNAGVIQSGKGKVRLLKISEYPPDWDPTKDLRTPVWEACHYMARALKESETTAGTLLAKMPEKAEPIRQLAYRLYTVCERKGWAEDARSYNELIASWHAIVEASHAVGHVRKQMELFED
ncbi:MAG: DUF1156 domain-containing protein [Desulfobacterales bacterium]|nr:DUF1156 domain-containing protein [Desulfobacterales bacterium]